MKIEYFFFTWHISFSYVNLSFLPSIRFWCQDYEEKLSEIIANLLISKYQNSSPNKRKRSMKNNSTQNTAPTADQVSRMNTECEPSQVSLTKKMFSFLWKSFSCSVIWNIFGGVAGMGMGQEPDYMYKMQCNVPFNKHFRIAVIAQRYVFHSISASSK